MLPEGGASNGRRAIPVTIIRPGGYWIIRFRG
jgi:hypothetical protein